MDNKRPQAAECTPGKMHKATKHGRDTTDARFRFLYPLWLKSPCPVPLCEVREPRRKKISLSVSHLYSDTFPTGKSNK